MSRFTTHALAVLALFTALLAARAVSAATYHGRSVDGKRYHASILNNDYGVIDNVEVKFHDETVYVYLRNGRLVLLLEDEEIADPHHILAEDVRRGITWEINVRELVGH